MENPLNDKKFKLGLVLYILTLVIFGSSFLVENTLRGDLLSLPFLLNYAIFWIYFLSIWEKKWRFSKRHRNILLLLIGNVSAYTLNRSIPVFNISTNWLAAYLVVLNISMLLYCFRKLLPGWINYSLPAVFCSGILFNLYECLYVAPFYPLSVIGSLFFLISLHILIPLWWVILLSKMIRPYFKKGTAYVTSILIGAAVPLGLIIGFISQWYYVNQQITTIYEAAAASKQQQTLPTWVQLSQVLDNDWVTRKILKSKLVYSTIDLDRIDFMPQRSRFDEPIKHDPLVVIAALLSPPLSLNGREQVSLLNSVFNQRHHTERKLWTGKDLRTKNVATTIQFFPEHQLAYTEKVIQIANHTKRRWQDQQEALYTFHLPEGAVVTSAALWVNGEERPSFLTTRNKADSAYTAIVGRERRDPLLLHWQEGNRITVRVFPVTPQEDRQFKIGITSPLRAVEDQLIYENPDFEGPHWEGATEQIRILGAADKLDFRSQLGFQSDGKEWTYEGHYHSDWTIKIDASALQPTTFSFDGQHFQLSPYYPTTTPFKASTIYLDINQSWSKREFKAIWEQVKYQEVYVYTDQLIRLNEQNKDQLFSNLRDFKFSLFPFHAIPSPQTALVITQNEGLTPVLDDLKKTKFSQQLNDFLIQQAQPVAVFDLGETPSLYMKSLKELRSIHHHTGALIELLHFLEEGVFIKNIENEQLITLPSMGLQIEQVTTTATPSTAPDHLMRLFTYNDLMKKIGRNYFKKAKLADALVAQAEKGFVVSPVSSLIVLETQADYDRFDIKQSKNSLKNASIQNAGSVPEPQEWVLIVLSLLVAITLWWKLKCLQ